MIISVELLIESYQDVLQFDSILTTLIKNGVRARSIGMKIIFKCEPGAYEMIKKEFERRLMMIRVQYDVTIFSEKVIS